MTALAIAAGIDATLIAIALIAMIRAPRIRCDFTPYFVKLREELPAYPPIFPAQQGRAHVGASAGSSTNSGYAALPANSGVPLLGQEKP